MTAQLADYQRTVAKRVRPVPSYFWWLREAQVRAGVTHVHPLKDATADAAASARRSSAA